MVRGVLVVVGVLVGVGVPVVGVPLVRRAPVGVGVPVEASVTVGERGLGERKVLKE